MVYFCKSGLMIIKDSSGQLYYFSPQISVREAAEYIWSNENLCEFHNEIEQEDLKDCHVNYIDPAGNGMHRLRSVSNLMDDKYYSDLNSP